MWKLREMKNRWLHFFLLWNKTEYKILISKLALYLQALNIQHRNVLRSKALVKCFKSLKKKNTGLRTFFLAVKQNPVKIIGLNILNEEMLKIVNNLIKNLQLSFSTETVKDSDTTISYLNRLLLNDNKQKVFIMYNGV